MRALTEPSRRFVSHVRKQGMRKSLVWAALLAVFPTLSVSASHLQPGDAVLISYIQSCLGIATPPTPYTLVSVIPRDSVVSNYDFPWSGYPLLTISYSDRVGMIISSDASGESILFVLHDDGSVATFGSGAPAAGGFIAAIAPTSTSVFLLALAPATGGGPAAMELWRMAPEGTLAARMPFPIGATSLDIAADQCTVFYTTSTGIGRFDACRGKALAEFASTDVPLNSVRIAPNGEVFAIDSRNQLVRFSADGRPSGTVVLPLSAERDEAISAFAFDETAGNLLVATSFTCHQFPDSGGRIFSVDRLSGQVVSVISPESASQDNIFRALAVVSEWRAAQPRSSPRRRVAGH